jgi:tetratricopeptide (TPR) repeat protein
MQTLDERQKRTANWLVEQALQCDSGPGARVRLAGSVGSGRTEVLHLAIGVCADRGKTPIFVGVPSANVENAAIVLSDVADCLAKNGRLNGEASLLEDPTRPWNEKLSAITRIIDQDADQFVLICDEPNSWGRHELESQSDYSDTRLLDVTRWILREARCPRIISGNLPGDLITTNPPTTNPPRAENWRDILTDRARWTSAADAAAAIVAEASPHSRPKSILGIKLLVALSWVTSPAEAALRIDTQANVLLSELLDIFQSRARNDERYRDVCTALSRLAMARCELSKTDFSRIVGQSDRTDQEVIRTCLCNEACGLVSLHPMIRHEVLCCPVDRDKARTRVWDLALHVRKSIHEKLFEIATAPGIPPTLRHDIDAFYHGVLSRDLDPTQHIHHLHFQSQLEGIGYALSRFYYQHSAAASVFRLALTYDDTSAYSHHYLAYNLDWIAECPDDVEEHYARAVQLYPTHPWYWSRWISYLATRGQLKRAREEWDNALDALSISDDSTPAWIYRALHQWVARWLLHWANLGFAEQVLQAIPKVHRNQGMIPKLFDLLAALKLAKAGKAVFPLTVPARSWWKLGPHTDLPAELDGHRLERWRPARIQDVGEDGELYLLCGAPLDKDTAGIEITETELSRKQVEGAAWGFGPRDLKEGRYIELGYYGTNQDLRIGLHRETQLTDQDLTKLSPPPNRWFDRAVREAWDEQQRSGA